ncbi:MAG TPA: alcohol dehydrogenase catalytic domain-containing protein [Thermoanaerobaculia bacterium]|nr:alcohol dehydrogenase catalytic domain-containing protein [Thermoanaerobaculia bacterium]
MKAVLVRSLDDLAVVEMERPVAGPGEIVVAMKAVGICGSDTTAWYVGSKAPVVLGHEPAGVVAEAGAGVRAFRPGDRVVVHHHAACGACRFCLAGEDVMCPEWKKTRLHPGGLAEYVRVEAAAVATDTFRLPDSLSFEDGALVEPLACAVKAVRRARVRAGDSVAVIGLGANGILLGLVAKSAGGVTLVGCDPDPARRAHARRLGFDETGEPGTDFSEKVKRASAVGADVVFVLPTAEAAVLSSLEAAGRAGRVVFYSPVEPSKTWRLLPHSLYLRDLSLLFSYSSGAKDFREALALIGRGVVRAKDLVTHRVPLARAADAFALARQGGDVLKVVVTI